MDRDVDEIGKLNHSLDANIVHRAFDLGNMRLRNACLFLNIALAQACVFSGGAEVFCEILALQLALDRLIAFVVPARWRLILRGDFCGFLATRSVKTDFRAFAIATVSACKADWETGLERFRLPGTSPDAFSWLGAGNPAFRLS